MVGLRGFELFGETAEAVESAAKTYYRGGSKTHRDWKCRQQ